MWRRCRRTAKSTGSTSAGAVSFASTPSGTRPRGPDASGGGAVGVLFAALVEHQRIAKPRPVRDLHRGAKLRQLSPQADDISPHGLLWESRVVPGFGEQLLRARKVGRPVGEPHEQLILPLRQVDRLFAIADGSLRRVDRQAFQLPLARVPELDPPLVSPQLYLEDADVVVDHVLARGGRQRAGLGAHAREQLV